MRIPLSVVAVAALVLTMFTVLALAGLPMEAVIALGSTGCLVAAELIRRIVQPSARRRRRR